MSPNGSLIVRNTTGPAKVWAYNTPSYYMTYDSWYVCGSSISDLRSYSSQDGSAVAAGRLVQPTRIAPLHNSSTTFLSCQTRSCNQLTWNHTMPNPLKRRLWFSSVAPQVTLNLIKSTFTGFLSVQRWTKLTLKNTQPAVTCCQWPLKILMTSLQVGILPGLRKTSCWFLCEFWQKISPLMVITFVSG